MFAQKKYLRTEVPSNAVLLESSGNQVRNIERAITQYCDPKGYAVLLKTGDKFNDANALAIIAAYVEDRSILGAFIDLKIKGALYEVKPDYLSFSRS